MNLSRRKTIELLSLTGLAGYFPQVLGNTLINEKMNSRIIPRTKEELPIVGLGSWIQFDVGDNENELIPLKEVLIKMVEKGGKVIDSSPMYGRAEQMIGDLAAETGTANHFFYATKVWTSGREQGVQQMEESFKKMRRKTMDLMQIHNLVDWKAHLATLEKWKKTGKIRYIGITHYSVSAHEQLEQIVRSGVVDFVQFNYSIGVRNAERSLLKAAHDHRVAVLINEPFQSGALFGKVKGKPLPPWAADYGISSWAQYFLKYIISNPAVTCVIPGTSNPKHLLDNMGAGYGPIPDEAGQQKMAAYFDQL
jgi:diketogulonate reductase-like aldo/keto reductase